MGPLAVAVTLLAACSGGDGLLLPSEGEPAAIQVVRGDKQSGRVSEPLAKPVVVEVTDSRGRPVEGATVTFELTTAGPGADIVPDTGITDANGEASAQIMLGTTIGQQIGTARLLAGTGTRASATSFTCMVLSESANSMAAVAGQDQIGRVGSPLDQRLVVQVTDAFGNPIAGVPISWSAEGGGSISDAGVSTDEEGHASVERILGPSAGQQTTIASSEGLAGSPVTFAHIALAGDASHLMILSGDDQIGRVGSELPAELVVRLIDSEGNGVPQAAVEWVVATGGGSVTPANNLTDEDGRASAHWTLGPSPGPGRLDAVVSGVGVASFDAIATAGAPAALAIRTQPPAAARNGVPFDRDPVIQLRDSQGNDVATAGVQVAVALGTGAGDLTGIRQRLTDQNGRATFAGLAITGPAGRYSLVFSSSGYASTTSTEIDVRAVPTITTISSDAPDPTAPGSPFTVEFRVASEGPTPDGTVSVTDGVESCSGILSGGIGRCQLSLSTSGDRTLLATYPGDAGLGGSSDTEIHRVQTPPPQNQPPTADYSSQCEGLTCQFSDRSSDPDGSIASRSWTFGDGSPASPDKDPAHTFSSSGSYVVTLTVTDDDGATDVATATVVVQAPPANQSPIAAFTAECKELSCRFNSDGSDDPDGRIVSWAWTFGDGASSNERNPKRDYAGGGTYTVTLTVTDDDGASNAVSHDVAVSVPPPPNQRPHAEFASSCSDLTCTFTDQSRDDDGSIVSWNWTFGDGSGSSEPSPSHQYAGPGKYQVELTVTDNSGGSDSKTHDVEATAPPPASTTVTITSDTPEPSDFGAPIVVGFTVTSPAGTPTGTVVVTEPGGGSCTGNAPSDSCTLSPGGSGTRALTATYQESSSFEGSSDTEDHTVNPPPPAGTTTTITGHSPEPSMPGEGVIVSILVSSGAGTPGGEVTVTVNDEPESCSSLLGEDGTASCSLALTNAGAHVLTAAYEGNSAFSGSSGTAEHTVNAPTEFP